MSNDEKTHDAGAHAAHGSKRKQYVIVFFALVILTGLELGVVKAGVAHSTLVLALIGLAVTKAAAVAMYFMHLKEETGWLKFTVLFPLCIFPPLYALVLIAESAWRAATGG